MTTVPFSHPLPGLLLERDHELRALDDALADGGRLIVVEGPPGVGKSALVARAAQRARTAAMVVVSAAATELERPVAFAVAAQLFRPILAAAGSARRAALLDGVAAPATALLVDGAIGPGVSFDNGEGVIQGLCWVAANLAGAETRRLFVVVDDAHWSDEGSLRLLGRLAADRPGAPPVVVMVALRPGEAGAGAPALNHLRRHPGAVVLRPEPLTASGVGQVVRSRFPAAAEEFARACGRASGGNPFFLGTLLDELSAEGMAPTADSAAGVSRLVPEAALRSVLLRLARLSADAVALAKAVAVLGERTPLARAATLADMDEAAAEDAADALAHAGLLHPGDPLGFTHPLIAAAVEADLPAFGRARAHRRAAELVAASGATPDVVAAHLLACRPRGDSWVVATLRAAADLATAAGEHRAAIEFLARAMQEPPDEDEWAAVHIAHALACAAGDEPGADGRLEEALGFINDRAQKAEAFLTLSRLLIGRGDFGRSAAVADRALADLDADDPLARPLLDTLLMAASRHAPRRLDALRRFEPLVAAARAGQLPDDPILCARLASRMATAGEAPERVRAMAMAALAAHPLVDPGAHGIAFAFVAAGIYWIDDFDWCQQAADAAYGAAQAQGSPIALMAATHWQAAAGRQLGQLDAAVAYAERSLSIRHDGWNALVGWTGAVLATTQVDRGDLAAGREALVLAETIGTESLDWAFVLGARGRLALASGDPTGAWEAFEAGGRHLADIYRIDHPGVLSWRSLAAVAAAQLGRDRPALELAQQELGRARELGLPRVLGHALRITGRLVGGREGVQMLEEAVAVLRPSSANLAHAYALVDFGTALHRGGHPEAAREHLGHGLRLAETFGAAPLVERAKHELHSAGGRRRRSETVFGRTAALTPAQLRVAKLAAGGLSNGQIAERLQVNLKTVEWHLGQIYRELGITGRRELGAIVNAG